MCAIVGAFEAYVWVLYEISIRTIHHVDAGTFTGAYVDHGLCF